MPLDLSRNEERRGTRKVMMWGVAIAALIFVALFVIFFLGVTA
jgi:predicted nucleic acid-binding Zn ribbon protein